MGNVRCTDGATAADVTTTPSGKATRKQQSLKRCAPSSHRALLLTGPSELPASATLLRSARQVNPVDPQDPSRSRAPSAYPGRLSVRSGRPGAQPCFLLTAGLHTSERHARRFTAGVLCADLRAGYPVRRQPGRAGQRGKRACRQKRYDLQS